MDGKKPLTINTEIVINYKAKSFDSIKKFCKNNNQIRPKDISLIDQMVSELQPHLDRELQPVENGKFFYIKNYQLCDIGRNFLRRSSYDGAKIIIGYKYVCLLRFPKKITITFCYKFKKPRSCANIYYPNGTKEKVYLDVIITRSSENSDTTSL